MTASFWSRVRPPAYGSAAYEALPADHPMRGASIRQAAESWRLLSSSPHIEDLLQEWVAWVERRDAGESSAAISAAIDWRQVANAPTFAELARRRSVYTTEPLTPKQIRDRAAASWAAVERRITAQQGVAA